MLHTDLIYRFSIIILSYHKLWSVFTATIPSTLHLSLFFTLFIVSHLAAAVDWSWSLLLFSIQMVFEIVDFGFVFCSWNFLFIVIHLHVLFLCLVVIVRIQKMVFLLFVRYFGRPLLVADRTYWYLKVIQLQQEVITTALLSSF